MLAEPREWLDMAADEARRRCGRAPLPLDGVASGDDVAGDDGEAAEPPVPVGRRDRRRLVSMGVAGAGVGSA